MPIINERKHALIVLWMMLFMWLTCSLLIGELVYRGISSKRWPPSEGLVGGPDLNPSKTRPASGILYYYKSGSFVYEGSRTSFQLHSGKEYNKITGGSRITVYVSPKSPKLSVLETGTDTPTVLLLTFSILATTLSSFAIWKKFRKQI